MDLAVEGRLHGNPVFIKLGIALALSFAGFIASQLRSRARSCPSSPSASRPPPSGFESQPIAKSSVGLKEELRILKSDEGLAKIVNGTSTTTTTTTTTRTTVMGLSPTIKSSGDDEGFLFSEFNDLMMKEYRTTAKDTEITTNNSTPKKSEIKEDSAMEQEIAKLKNLVWCLQEKERNLEFQLLEYYGMQEREAAVRELESQLKITTVEAKLYSLKIESLQADNHRLQAQLMEHSRVMNELEAARVTIKLLKKKLKSDGNQAKEKIVSLHQRISVLQCQEEKEEKDNEEFERKFKRLKELEDDAAELKKINSRIAEENSYLVRQLETTKASGSSALEGPEVDALEEANWLRESNEKLMKDIEQLKTDRCADVEELVYLRWVNACLRYEMRNYQMPPGKTVARDLSKSLSPRSEEKAKQLILEYAGPGPDEKSLSSMDFDWEYSSSSQASTGEPEDASIDISSSTKRSNSNKQKFLAKLKMLVLGKDTNRNKASSIYRTPGTPRSINSSGRRVSLSVSSIDDIIGRDSYGGFSPSITEEPTPANRSGRMDAGADEQCQNEDAWSQVYSRPPLDIKALQRLNLEEEGKEKVECYKRDVGTPYRFERTHSGEDTVQDSEGGDTPEKVEIKKFAGALKKTRGMSTLNGRSASFSS